METTKILADDIVRRMAHRFASRKGLGEMRAEEIIDHSATLVWAQRVPQMPEEFEQMLATAIALACHQRGKKIAYDALVAEREALAQWAARRVPSSVFVGDDGGELPDDFVIGGEAATDLVGLAKLGIAARVLVNRMTGYVPMWELSAYHAG